jgi:hypothetical protein
MNPVSGWLWNILKEATYVIGISYYQNSLPKQIYMVQGFILLSKLYGLLHKVVMFLCVQS